MASTDSSDVLMMFEISAGSKLAAEAKAAFYSSASGTTDDLMNGFEVGYFFEVESFDFGVGVTDSEGEKPGGGAESKGGGNALHGDKGRSDGSPKEVKPSGPKFAKFIYPPGGRVQKLNYPIDVQPFSFTRQLDKASPILFDQCANLKPFKSAALVKRKFTGGQIHEVYLRLDFKDVLVVGVDWDDGEFVKEKCTFVCREIMVTYKPQQNDGTLGSPLSGQWSAVRKLQGSGSQ